MGASVLAGQPVIGVTSMNGLSAPRPPAVQPLQPGPRYQQSQNRFLKLRNDIYRRSSAGIFRQHCFLYSCHIVVLRYFYQVGYFLLIVLRHGPFNKFSAGRCRYVRIHYQVPISRSRKRGRADRAVLGVNVFS